MLTWITTSALHQQGERNEIFLTTNEYKILCKIQPLLRRPFPHYYIIVRDEVTIPRNTTSAFFTIKESVIFCIPSLILSFIRNRSPVRGIGCLLQSPNPEFDSFTFLSIKFSVLYTFPVLEYSLVFYSHLH